MAKILLVEQHVNRSFDSLLIINELLRELGHDSRVSLSGSFMNTEIIWFEPQIIYTPWLSPKIMNFLGELGVAPLLLNSFQEQNLLLDEGFHPHLKQLRMSNYFFSWGDVYGEAARAINPDIRYYSAGVTRYDAYLNPTVQDLFLKTKKDLAEAFSIPEATPWVLVAFDYALLFKPKRREKALRMGFVDQEYLDVTQKAFDRLSQWLDILTRNNPGTSFILRPHPGAPLHLVQQAQGIADRPNVFYNSSGNINQWIIHCDRYLTRLSSSIMEAWLANKPTCTLFPDLQNEEIRNYVHLREPQLTAATVEEVQAFLEAPEPSASLLRHRPFLERIFGQVDGCASARTARFIDQIAREEQATLATLSRRVPHKMPHWQYPLANQVKHLLRRTNLFQYSPWRNSPADYVAPAYVRTKSAEVRRALPELREKIS
ncbi:MAG: hypothetical protein AAFW73_06605 [Bacteroidota bacterium]